MSQHQGIRSSNNFDLIRLIAAASVIISHSYDLLGLGIGDILSRHTNGRIGFSDLGVWSFFIISGFLIDQSLERADNVVDYFWKRILRIYPGLIVVVLISAFIIGPVFTTHDLAFYFRQAEFFNYLINLTLFQTHYLLPGVFESNPLPFVNGSLWTLPYEFFFYILISLQFVLKGRGRSVFILVTFTVFLVFHLMKLSNGSLPLFWLSYEKIFYLGIFFMSGSLINKLKLHKKIVRIDAVLIIVLTACSLFLMPKDIFGFVFLPLFIFRIAYLKAGKLTFLTRYGDFSYGIYIYAFPIQQVLVSTLNLNLTEMVCLSFLFSFILGALSWHFIEKRALKYKSFVSNSPSRDVSVH